MRGRRQHRSRSRRTVLALARAASKCVWSVWTFLATLALGGAIAMLVAWKVYGLVPVAVQTGSMEPTLPVASLMFVQEVPPTSVKVGDIIMFDAPGTKVGRVTHRVVRRSERDGQLFFETKGDANKHVDDWSRFVPAPTGTDGARQSWAPGISYGDRPAVRYVWGVPYLGRLAELSSRPRLRLGLLVGILALTALAALARIWCRPVRVMAAHSAAANAPGPLLPATATGSAVANAGIAPVDEGDEAPARVRVVPPAVDVTEPGRVAISVASDQLLIRSGPDALGVTALYRVPVPATPPPGALAHGTVVDAFNEMADLLEARVGESARHPDRATLDVGAAGAALAPGAAAGAWSPTLVSASDFAGALRALATHLGTSEGASDEERRSLMQLVAIRATLLHLAIEQVTVVADSRDWSSRPGAGARLAARSTAIAAAALAAFTFGAVGMSSAALIDTAGMAPVALTGDQLRPAPSMSFVSSSGAGATNLRTSWTTPTGIPPSSYDLWRSTSPGVDTSGAPTANLTASPWDVSLAQCSVYYFKTRSRFASMISAESAEYSWMHDGTAPVVSDTAVVATSGPSPVLGWVRPGASFYLYATVNDNCAASSDLTVTFDTSSLVSGGSTTAPASFGSWQPISGGATYNFRIGPLTARATLADGSNPPWSVTSTVPALYHSHSTTTAGAAPNVDGTAPSVNRTPVLVADKTNYFAPEAGRGAVPQSSAFRLVGSYADGGVGLQGAGGSVADISTLATTASVELTTAGAPFSTENGIDTWTHRTPTGASAPVTKVPLADGDQTITIVTQDRLGNSTTNTINGRIDSTAPALTSCTNTNGGLTGALDGNDATVLDFSETMDPGSFVDGWTDGSSSVTGLQFKVWDGEFLFGLALANDIIEYAGTRIQAAATLAEAYDIGSAKWVSSGVFASGFALYGNSAVERIAGQAGARWTLHYRGSSTVARPTGLDTPAGETFNLRTSGAGTWDVAGNNVATGSLACLTSPW